VTHCRVRSVDRFLEAGSGGGFNGLDSLRIGFGALTLPNSCRKWRGRRRYGLRGLLIDLSFLNVGQKFHPGRYILSVLRIPPHSLSRLGWKFYPATPQRGFMSPAASGKARLEFTRNRAGSYPFWDPSSPRSSVGRRGTYQTDGGREKRREGTEAWNGIRSVTKQVPEDPGDGNKWLHPTLA